MGKDPYLPHCLGHEATGVVADIGLGVTKVKKNDPVVLHWMKGSGIQSDTPDLKWKNNKLNAGSVTTFSQYTIVSENRITKISKKFNLKTAALLGCVASTGIGSIINEANVKPYHKVAIIGIGSLGLSVILGANISRAEKVIAFDSRKISRNRANKLGAQSSYKIGDKRFYDYFDKVFICVSLKNFIQYGQDICSYNGEIFICGNPQHNDRVSLNSLSLHRNKVLKGSHGGGIVPERDIISYYNLHQRKIINLNQLILKVYKFTDINKPIKKMLDRTAGIGRYLIKF
jgi:hypothetical protein